MRWALLAVCLLWLSGGARTGWSWDASGHRLYLEKAIDALPDPVKDFYDNRRGVLLEAITDPTRFGKRRIFEVDRLEPFPFDALPTERELAARKYGEETLEETGDTPWQLIESYRALVEAYRERDFEAVSSHSLEIAHLVGELYVPPNVSRDGDGDPIDQHGLRERFDSRLLEFHGGEVDVDTPHAVYLDRPAEYAVSIPVKSFIWVDNILYYDQLSGLGVTSYDRFYYEGMWLRLEALIRELLAGAALDTASFWYTAWVEAGKPELPGS